MPYLSHLNALLPLQNIFGKRIYLHACGVARSTSRPVDARWTHDCRLRTARRRLADAQDDLVNVSVQGIVRDAGHAVDPIPVVELVIALNTPGVIAEVLVGQNASTGRVNDENRP